MRLLSQVLRKLIRNGRLVITTADGEQHSFGSGDGGGEVHLRFADGKLPLQIALNPDLAVGEAYMDGRLIFEGGSSPRDLLMLYAANRRPGRNPHLLQRMVYKTRMLMRRLHQANPLGQAAKNVRHHYDIGNDFYALWLDEAMNYSCAYFRDRDDDLETAQRAKLDHVAAKLCLEPDMHVLDIGCGWGALAIHLAKNYGVRVTGLSVSPEQIALARQRAEAAGVADKVEFVECDYREMGGAYDRIISIGMMEHVGERFFDQYFGIVGKLLKPDGAALIHAIGRMSPPNATGPFVRKYIFPGGYAPSMSEVFASTERSSLWVDDCEILRQHYAWTLNHWFQRFMAHRDEVVEMYDERFARMWEFYLVAAESWFEQGPHMVFQLVLSHKRDAVPVTRDYVAEAEGATFKRR